MVVMMDTEISCKGHCEKLSHFLDHVSHTDKTILRIGKGWTDLGQLQTGLGEKGLLQSHPAAPTISQGYCID